MVIEMFKRINEQQAKDKLNINGAILLDVRDIDSYNSGHIGQAIHLTNDNVSDIITNTSKEVPVLVMCYHGNSSQNVAAYFAQQGFSEVYSIDGGYEGWSDK